MRRPQAVLRDLDGFLDERQRGVGLLHLQVRAPDVARRRGDGDVAWGCAPLLDAQGTAVQLQRGVQVVQLRVAVPQVDHLLRAKVVLVPELPVDLPQRLAVYLRRGISSEARAGFTLRCRQGEATTRRPAKKAQT